MALSKSDIMGRTQLPREEVPVPEWGGTVWVRTLTGWEYDQYEAESLKVSESGEVTPSLHNASGRLAVLVICDEDGKRIFDNEDAQEVGRKSKPALDRVIAAARRLNGLGKEAKDAAEKNSASAPA